MSEKKTAITVSELAGMKSPVDPRFGRAFAFVIVDSKTRKVLEQIENESTNAAHGAGTGSAALMKSHGVEAVVTGNFGPKAYQALEQMGIEMWMAKEGMTVSQVLDELESGNLPKMEMRRY